MRLSPWALLATFAVAVVMVGALTIGSTAGAASTLAGGCSSQPCGTQSGPRTPPPSCVQSASCGGGGALALAGGFALWAAVLGAGVLALGLALVGGRVARRGAAHLLAGIPAMLLRPPQAA